jgi:hypothetical protein
MIDYNTIDPLHHNLLKGKDMTAAETHTIEKEYFEMKKTYHMALDMLEEEKEKNKILRAENMELKYQKKPSQAA